MDTSDARRLAAKAVASAGRVVLRRGDAPGTEQQTLTIARPVENVLGACRDPEVLATLLGPAGTVRQDGPGRFSWTVADTEITTELRSEPNRVVFASPDGEPLVVEAWPAPRWGGSEVVVRLTLPAPGVAGGLAFTMAYRLRALLQTGEVATLGDVPSGRKRPDDAGKDS